MEVKLHYVNPDVTHLYNTHDGIQICTITVDQSAFGVDDFGYLLDVFFKETQSVGVGYHDAGCIFVHDLGNGLDRKDSLFIRCYGHRTIAAQRCAGRICAVCGIRNDDF